MVDIIKRTMKNKRIEILAILFLFFIPTVQADPWDTARDTISYAQTIPGLIISYLSQIGAFVITIGVILIIAAIIGKALRVLHIWV